MRDAMLRQFTVGWYGIPRTICAIVAATIFSQRGNWLLMALSVAAAICSLLVRRLFAQAFDDDFDEDAVPSQQARLLMVTIAKLGIPMLLLAGVLALFGWWRG